MTMETNKKTPRVHTPSVPVQLNIAYSDIERKGNEFYGNPAQIQMKVLNLFLSGGQYSNVDISRIIRTPDPRSHIRELRKRGIKILDYWIKTENSRYKIYFIK